MRQDVLIMKPHVWLMDLVPRSHAKVELMPKLTDDLLKACVQFDVFHKKLNKKRKTPASSSKKPAPE